MGMAAPPLVMRGGNHPPDTKADQTPIKRDHQLHVQRLSKHPGKCESGKGSDCLSVAWGLELSSTFPIQEWEPRRSIEMEKRWTLIQIFIWKVCHRNHYHGSLTIAQPSFGNVSWHSPKQNRFFTPSLLEAVQYYFVDFSTRGILPPFFFTEHLFS